MMLQSLKASAKQVGIMLEPLGHGASVRRQKRVRQRPVFTSHSCHLASASDLALSIAVQSLIASRMRTGPTEDET
jgi:hypothetical protein